MAKKTWDDDDGRTVADMSDLYVRTPIGYYRLGDRAERAARKKAAAAAKRASVETSPEDRKSYIWGALSAALLIGLAFIVGLGLLILFLFLIFKSRM